MVVSLIAAAAWILVGLLVGIYCAVFKGAKPLCWACALAGPFMLLAFTKDDEAREPKEIGR